MSSPRKDFPLRLKSTEYMYLKVCFFFKQLFKSGDEKKGTGHLHMSSIAFISKVDFFFVDNIPMSLF